MRKCHSDAGETKLKPSQIFSVINISRDATYMKYVGWVIPRTSGI